MFGPFSTGLQKFRLKTGFNVGTLLVNTPEMTSYTPLDAGYCFCVYTLNWKCHILGVNIAKHFNNTSKTTRPRGQAGRGRGHNCHEAEASNHKAEAEAGFLGLETETTTYHSWVLVDKMKCINRNIVLSSMIIVRQVANNHWKTSQRCQTMYKQYHQRCQQRDSVSTDQSKAIWTKIVWP